MQHRRFALLVALALTFAGGAHGQPPANPEVPTGQRTVNLSLEQRHVIRELVKDLKIDPAPIDAKVSVGDDVPSEAPLQPVPPLIGQKVPQIKAHRFYVTRVQVIIVDPQDRKVVEVVE